MAEHEPAARLDVTRDVCPMTFVKTKLELEDLAVGQVLEVLVREGESHENVIRSSREDGHDVYQDDTAREGVRRLLIRRG